LDKLLETALVSVEESAEDSVLVRLVTLTAFEPEVAEWGSVMVKSACTAPLVNWRGAAPSRRLARDKVTLT
jgi:hypothetical protein